MPHKDPAARAEYQRAYRASAAGKAALAHATAKYRASPKGKTTLALSAAKYAASPEGKASRSRRNAKSAEKRATQADALLTKLWAEARIRARKKARAFDEAAKPTVLPLVCPLTGISLSLAHEKRGSGRGGPRRPSLDQIVPGAGYTPGNVRVISSWANKSKGILSDPEHLAFCTAVVLQAARDGRTVADAPIRLQHALRTMSFRNLFPS